MIFVLSYSNSIELLLRRTLQGLVINQQIHKIKAVVMLQQLLFFNSFSMLQDVHLYHPVSSRFL